METLNPTLSILIPVYQGGEKFQRCLESVRNYAAAVELIVVADGNTGNDADLARRFGAKVLITDKPVGAALARNLAATLANSNILFFIDADVCLSPNTIAQVLAEFAAEPGLTALIGSYDNTPAEPDFLSQYRNLLHHYTHQQAKSEASTFWGACGALRNRAFTELGGFNDVLLEDVELGYRLREAGHRIRLNPAIQVKHLKRWTPLLMLKTDIFIRAIPWTRLILKYRHLPNDLNLRIENRISVIVLFLLLQFALLGFVWSSTLWLSLGLALILLALNFPLYYFFWQLKGLHFALQTIPWHWFYYFYSAMAYAIGNFQHFYNKHS